MATATTAARSKKTGRFVESNGAGVAVGAAAAGLVAGLAANFVRKAIVQAPTMLAGDWDEALKAEHKLTLAVMDKIEATDETQTTKRTMLLTNLKHMLAKHAIEEENAIYAALRDEQQADEADRLNHDHGYVKQYLYDLTVMPRSAPMWLAKVRELRGLLEKHMREEEDTIFPALKARLDEQRNKELTTAMNKEGLKIA